MTATIASELGHPAAPIERPSSEGGFTLVEAMVVVLVIGILLAVAIPTFLGARHRAQDTQAAGSLRSALTASIETSNIRSDFTEASPTALAEYEPTLTYVDASTPSTGPQTVSIDATSPTRWVAVARSDSGTCFAVVAGPFGQVEEQDTACAAANISLEPPGDASLALTHQGAITADTDGMCLEVVAGGFLQQQPCTGSQPPLRIETLANGYSIVSVNDGSCFGTASPNRGARVLEEICEASDDQLWTVIPAFDGTVQFKNKETGYCLDVNGNSSSAGAPLISWGFGNAPNGTCKPTTEPNNHNFGLG